MLYDLIEQGFGNEEDLNCAEKILCGANEAYHMGLDKNALKLAAGFGGGMAIEDKCGAITGAIMALGNLVVSNNAHESNKIKELTKEFFKIYEEEMGSIDCAPLKERHRTEEVKCKYVIMKAAQILDQMLERQRSLIDEK